jgi:hypothetical protein
MWCQMALENRCPLLWRQLVHPGPFSRLISSNQQLYWQQQVRTYDRRPHSPSRFSVAAAVIRTVGCHSSARWPRFLSVGRIAIWHLTRGGGILMCSLLASVKASFLAMILTRQSYCWRASDRLMPTVFNVAKN